MIRVLVGATASQIIPRFVYPERGMSPRDVVTFTHLLVDSYQNDTVVEVLTWSPILLNTLNAALLAHKTGVQLRTPPLDPKYLEALRVKGEEIVGLFDADGLIEVPEIDAVGAELDCEIRFLKKMDERQVGHEVARRLWRRVQSQRLGMVSTGGRDHHITDTGGDHRDSTGSSSPVHDMGANVSVS